ncbi:hypothetical protein Syun_021095 [Stephania yunnanensis]|uniref:Uncharacterized protein n=1 Tax=Stephania yunnanensis TaxID=152371 RepID=A0AAP0IF76_9MAGN
MNRSVFHDGQSRKQQFDGLIERLMNKVLIRRERLLSPAGKEVLLKAVAQAIPN